ncbi:hypothetical protein [Oleiagrimonas sp. C23AA]|uniref:hypothetical protein n=1 Tax=Oleiagrimonas sp. C23AA TaxID=2719047 RepID=UPI00141E0F5C|nr:hypothetical protein [Oleiagrimonas sp. C23AA]NII09754.1 hypothetical protein [Oleiagrimonas sp. C23AA]
MLRKTLMWVGAACLLLGLLLLASAGTVLLAPQLLVLGVVLLLGLAIERWRYKRVHHARPAPHWQDTGERFVDPESGQLTAVYFDPATAERHYLGVRDAS